MNISLRWIRTDMFGNFGNQSKRFTGTSHCTHHSCLKRELLNYWTMLDDTKDGHLILEHEFDTGIS